MTDRDKARDEAAEAYALNRYERTSFKAGADWQAEQVAPKLQRAKEVGIELIEERDALKAKLIRASDDGMELMSMVEQRTRELRRAVEMCEKLAASLASIESWSNSHDTDTPPSIDTVYGLAQKALNEYEAWKERK